MAENAEGKADLKVALETYKLYMARYNAIFPMVYTDLKFYIGLLTAVISGTALFSLSPTDSVNPLVARLGISVGGVLLVLGTIILGLSVLGYYAVRSSWEAWARSISSVAKLEFLLGLSIPQEERNWNLGVASRVLWKREPIVFPKHILDDSAVCSSEQFISKAKPEGYLKIAKWLFMVTGFIGLYVMLRGLVVAGVVIC